MRDIAHLPTAIECVSPIENSKGSYGLRALTVSQCGLINCNTHAVPVEEAGRGGCAYVGSEGAREISDSVLFYF